MTRGEALPWPVDPLPAIAAAGRERPVIVVDDDPTGTQTLGDINVLLGWDPVEARNRLAHQGVCYVITNTRSLAAPIAAELDRGIGRDLRSMVELEGRLSIISRTDSTLRGHFPEEPDALAQGFGTPDAVIVLAPYFGEAGRITRGAVHQVLTDGGYRPVAETEFARDPTFGYRASDLRAWVHERAGANRIVGFVPLEDLRGRGPEAVSVAIAALPAKGVLVVDSVVDRDIEVVALGVLEVERQGRPVIARTAASYVRARLARPRPDSVGLAGLVSPGPGLLVVGSHTASATRQLERLVGAANPPLEIVELDVAGAAIGEVPSAAVAIAAARVTAGLAAGRTCVLQTSRMLVRADDPGTELGLAARVSTAVVGAVRVIDRRPAWLIAKGGITSHDIAMRGLGMRRADVLGPALPGIPVWLAGPESRWPGLLYVVVPGNVGDDDALVRLVADVSGPSGT